MIDDDEDDCLDEYDHNHAMRGLTGCVMAMTAISTAAVSVIVGSFALAFLTFPLGAAGLIIGLCARRSKAGRFATAGGILALVLSGVAVFAIYGIGMAGSWGSP